MTSPEQARGRHVAFISGSYPSPARPGGGTFVQQFVWAMARQGNRCSVLHPTSLFDRRFGPLPPRLAMEAAGGGAIVEVHRPRFASFSSRDLGWSHTGRWTQSALEQAVVRDLQSWPNRPDLIYGHFLYPAGRAAVAAGRCLGVPSVVGVGEGTFWTVDPFGFDQARKDFTSATAFLAVGSHIRNGLIGQIGVPGDKIRVEPNGVDRSRFFPVDRAEARRRLGRPLDRFLVVFVGTFDNLKGGQDLVAAVEGIEDLDLAMIGQGDVVFESKRIIHQGLVPHRDVATWLNAANVFVLPTREEGSCNAVVEALACGVPVVTASGDYMDDLVDGEVSLRVDPADVAAIRAAILSLKEDPGRRQKMSEACLRKARGFDINERARRVTAWMESLVARQGAGGNP